MFICIVFKYRNMHEVGQGRSLGPIAFSTPMWNRATRFYFRVEGQLSPKTCLTNSKHRHICAKRSVLWPSKYAKMRFWPGFRRGPRSGAHDASIPPSRLGRGHSSPYQPLSATTAIRFTCFRRLNFGGSNHSHLFFSLYCACTCVYIQCWVKYSKTGI